MMKKFIRYLWVTAVALLSFSAAAETASQTLANSLGTFQSLSAHFTQNVYDGKGHIIQKNTGNMALQRPGKFRWHVVSPNPQLLLADGRYLWIFDQDLEQATRQAMDKDNANSPASLLSGSIESLENRFNVKQLKASSQSQTYQLKPNNQHDLFKWIELTFTAGKLSSMKLSDNTGSLTEFQFHNVKVNPSLSKSLFQFKPPKGVEVIKN